MPLKFHTKVTTSHELVSWLLQIPPGSGINRTKHEKNLWNVNFCTEKGVTNYRCEINYESRIGNWVEKWFRSCNFLTSLYLFAPCKYDTISADSQQPTLGSNTPPPDDDNAGLWILLIVVAIAILFFLLLKILGTRKEEDTIPEYPPPRPRRSTTSIEIINARFESEQERFANTTSRQNSTGTPPAPRVKFLNDLPPNYEVPPTYDESRLKPDWWF